MHSQTSAGYSPGIPQVEVLFEDFSAALNRNVQVRLLTYGSGAQDLLCPSGTDKTQYDRACALLEQRGLSVGEPDKDWLTGVYYPVTAH